MAFNTYNYNANTNVLEWVKYPKDTDATRTNYTYDSMYRMATASVTTDTGTALTASYTYTNDLLTKIQTGSTAYNFGYGNFNLRSSITIGSRTLASYSYTDRTHYLSALDYGNGDSVDYTYDQQGRVTKETYEDGDTVTYQYDNSGALATITDSATGRTTAYYYDFTDRLMEYVESGSGYHHSVGYTYDNINNLTALAETISGSIRTTSYAYDDDNRVTSITNSGINKDSAADDVAESYTYDSYGRVHQKITTYGGATILTETYTYREVSGKQTGQVATMQSVSGGRNVLYTYEYDSNGNITSVSDGTYTTTYSYDSANQLIRENNQAAGVTWTYTYDNAGNILSKSQYAYTTGSPESPTSSIGYSYDDSSWGDLLTYWNGKNLSYDTIGNLTSNGIWSYTWEHGRELASMSDDSTTWSFTYNADGLRTQRTNGSRTYSYVYNGSSLSQLTVDGHTMRFTYDASGSPLSVTYDGTEYYYVLNLQGDVVAILDGSGSTVVAYTYDAWGDSLSATGSLSNTLGFYNPLCYRGYVYDTETTHYYLQSRYYYPYLCRFVNADAVTSTGQGLLGNNMFAYCNNNPVNYLDPTGSAGIWYYLFLDSDFGFIHRMVVKHIAANYKVDTEVLLSTFGRADVVQDGLVWEVKHAGVNPSARITEAWAQAFTYQLLNEEITALGAAGAFCGEFYICCGNEAYLVEYKTPTSGVILYTVKDVQNYTGQYYAVFVPSTDKQEQYDSSFSLAQVPAGLPSFAAVGGCMFAGVSLFAGLNSSSCVKNILK